MKDFVRMDPSSAPRASPLAERGPGTRQFVCKHGPKSEDYQDRGVLPRGFSRQGAFAARRASNAPNLWDAPPISGAARQWIDPPTLTCPCTKFLRGPLCQGYRTSSSGTRPGAFPCLRRSLMRAEAGGLPPRPTPPASTCPHLRFQREPIVKGYHHQTGSPPPSDSVCLGSEFPFAAPLFARLSRLPVVGAVAQGQSPGAPASPRLVFFGEPKLEGYPSEQVGPSRSRHGQYPRHSVFGPRSTVTPGPLRAAPRRWSARQILV